MMLMEMEIGRSSRSLTVEDLEGMPDDGRRYELIDGELLVSPAPGTYHQSAVGKLFTALDQACPDGLVVLPAPYAFQANAHTEVQPDLLVARIGDVTVKKLIAPPVLAVEVLSPSSSVTDFSRKKDLYQRVGVSGYWVIEPAEPRLVAFELDAHGSYDKVAEVGPGEVFEAGWPFPVRVVPGELQGRLRGLQLPD
ncbi:Uma2 family endonuclease [Pseudonocardiaceae bacterium YIM PH 21723]|nr:Uma2 family endonuclease [Pseudonocardiaceae bacterium YIM PH 21723]